MSYGLSKLKVRKLLKQVARIEQKAPLPDTRQPLHERVNEREREFLKALTARGKGSVPLRSGWPDFLILEEGRGFAVEVKGKYDLLSHAQVEMFSALEALDIAVFVWTPSRSTKLTPWRKWPNAKSPPRTYPRWARTWFKNEVAGKKQRQGVVAGCPLPPSCEPANDNGNPPLEKIGGIGWEWPLRNDLAFRSRNRHGEVTRGRQRG